MNWLVKIWYKASLTACLLYPLALIFRLLRAIRRLSYRLGIKKCHRFSVPIIVVGNITAGGTGKTPLVIYLIELLRRAGYKPGVVSRGYGGSGNDVPNIVTRESLATTVGDEAVMIVHRTGVPMVVCRKRVTAVRQLLASHDVDVIISDDGLQHYAMARDIEIAVIDGERRFGNGWCLPAGPLREPVARLKEVDLIVCNGEGQKGEFSMHLLPGHFYQVNDPNVQQKAEDFNKDEEVYAVAGIGNPKRFFHVLELLGISFIECAYPDHHRYIPRDLDFAMQTPIIMTEKDAVKCRDFADPRLWCMPVTAELDPAFDESVLLLLKELSR